MRSVELDVFALEGARDAWRANARDEVLGANVEGMSLGAALEAACWQAVGDESVRQLVTAWSSRSPALELAIRVLACAPVASPEDHASPSFEVRPCPTTLQLTDGDGSVEWRYFLERFRRSLVERLALGRQRTWQLSGAFQEMADNVVQHANLARESRGVVGYVVTPHAFEFAVADLGRGVLASLRENPRHAALQGDGEALLAACTEGASRRLTGAGSGFAQLLRALADLESWLSFRSGSARLVIDGRGTDDRREVVSNSLSLRGFQLAIRGGPRVSRWGA